MVPLFNKVKFELPFWGDNISLFFLICVAIAGIYGALTVEKKILFVQTVPAGLAILMVLLG